MRKLTLITVSFVFCLIVGTAYGQQFDAAFGVSSLTSPSAITSGGVIYPTEGGGAYPGFSADLLVHHRFGVEGEMFWRASQNLYGGYQPYRPIFYAFNAMWAPRLGKDFTGELLGGIGGSDLRFYGIENCSYAFGCTSYTSSNHFMGDVGGGLRAYFWHNAFIRPEARFYFVHNNVEFSSSRSVRYGVSLGYSFGGK